MGEEEGGSEIVKVRGRVDDLVLAGHTPQEGRRTRWEGQQWSTEEAGRIDRGSGSVNARNRQRDHGVE